jgi:hypothetical protein
MPPPPPQVRFQDLARARSLCSECMSECGFVFPSTYPAWSSGERSDCLNCLHLESEDRGNICLRNMSRLTLHSLLGNTSQQLMLFSPQFPDYEKVNISLCYDLAVCECPSIKYRMSEAVLMTLSNHVVASYPI